MTTKEMADIILNNLDLFNRQNIDLQKKVKGVAFQCSHSDKHYVSPKQISFLRLSYDQIEPILRKQKQEVNRISKLSPMDQLWDKYASDEYDEESGPYKALNYKYFAVIYTEMQNRIVELENALYEERMGEDL